MPGRPEVHKPAEDGCSGRETILKDLLDVCDEKTEITQAGANVQDTFGQTPVHWCVQYQVANQNILEQLLQSKGADLNVQDADGATALLLAVQIGRAAAAKMLIKEGADPNIADHDGITPLHVAAYEADRGALDVLLLTYELDVDVQDNNGLTPLHKIISRFGLPGSSETARKVQLYVIETLVKARADLELKDARGQTAGDRISKLDAGSRRDVEAAVKRGRVAAAVVKPRLQKECPDCQKELPQTAFLFVNWTKGHACQDCQHALPADSRVEELLYVPTELEDIPDIIPTYQQYIAKGSLAEKEHAARFKIDDDATRVKGIPPMLDEVFQKADDRMPFDQLVRLIRSKNINIPDSILKMKNTSKRQQLADNLYWTHAYRSAVGKTADNVVIMEIKDPKHPMAIHTQGKHFYGLFLDKDADPIPKGAIIGEYVGEVVDDDTLQEEKDEQLDDDEVNIQQLSNEEYLMSMDSTRKWFQKRGADHNNLLHVNALRYRNAMAAINDYRGYGRKGASVFFREVMINSWRHLFVTALEDIKPGEELLADYGQQYWDSKQELKRAEDKLEQKIKNAAKIERTEVGNRLLVEVEWIQERHSGAPKMQDLILDFRAAVKRAVPSAGSGPIDLLREKAKLGRTKKARTDSEGASGGGGGGGASAGSSAASAAPKWKETWVESEVKKGKGKGESQSVVQSCPLCNMPLPPDQAFNIFAHAAECYSA